MKKIFKILGLTVISILILLYICFLFVLPKVVDLSPYKQDLQNIVTKEGKVTLNYENERIITTPFLGIGVQLDNVSVQMPDKTLLFSSNSTSQSGHSKGESCTGQ